MVLTKEGLGIRSTARVLQIFVRFMETDCANRI
ncbi:MAG: hypothetical protein WBA59_02530 [Moheibacter sp.]